MAERLASLERSERRFREIYELAPMGMALMDFHTGRFVQCNPRFCEIVKRRAEELVQLNFQTITHPEDLPEHLRKLADLEEGETRVLSIEKRYLLPDGGNVWVNLTMVPMWPKGGTPDFYMAMVEDISVRKRTEETLRRQADFDALITPILAQFASCIGPAIDEHIRGSLQQMAVFTGAETAYVILGSQDLSTWSSAYESAIPGVQRPLRTYRDVPIGTFPWTAQRLLAGQVVEIRTLDDFPPEGAVDRAQYEADGVQSVLLVPLRGQGGRAAGCIGLHSYSHPQAWLEADVRRLQIIADAIANMLERKRVENALYESRQMLQQILDTIPQRVFWKDRDLNYIGCNQPFAHDANCADPQDVIGKNDFHLFPREKEIAERYRATDREIIETGQPKMGYEEMQVRQEGVISWVRTSKAPLYDREGRIFGVLGTYEDITDLRRTREALSEAKEAAEAANHAKDQFIAVLSHELRTPLTPVLAVVSAMETFARFPAEVRSDMEMIRRNVELESRLIDDLLDSTRISQGKVALHPEFVDIHDCLRSAEGFCESGISSKHLNVELKLEAEEPYVWGDPVRLRQVFWNLLQNAVKFTPAQGKILLHTFNEGQRVKVHITDNGIGIEPEAIERIFNPFEQGEQTWTRRFGGLGLGLSIAKGLVELHQGAIRVQSEGKDKGATFAVEFPTVKPVPQTSASTPEHEPGAPALTKILLVDDHADTLRILTRLLRRWGYSVTTADGVQSALARAAEEKFDLLISDLGLPDGSGRDIMREVKANYQLRGIVLSGYGTDEDIRASLEAGFEEHLTKPVGFQALQMAVQRLSVRASGDQSEK